MRGVERWELLAVVVLSLAAFVLMVFPFVQNLDSNVVPISLTYDNYYHPLMAKSVHDTGQHRVYAPYRAMGITDAVLADPPLPYSIPATVAMLTKAPVYNVFAIIAALFQIFMCLGVYALARRHFNPPMALFALAIALIPATSAWLFQYTIGFTTSLEAFAFVPFILLMLMYLYDRKSWLASALAGAALAVQLMIHGPIECAYVYVFVSAAMGIMWWRTRKKWLPLSWAVMSASAAVFGGYQYYLLNLLRLTGENIAGTLLAGNPIPDYFPMPQIGWVLMGLAIIGGIVLALRLVQRKATPAQTTLLIFIIMMIGISLSFVIGVDGSRTMRQYYNAYPFLALIPAAGIYAVLRAFKSKIPENAFKWIDLAIVALILFLSFSPTFAQLKGISGSGMATPQRWQALQWVKENTPADAIVFYLFGFEHEFEMLSERVVYKGDLGLGFTQKNIVSLCNQQYPETYAGQWGAAFSVRPGKVNGTQEYPERKGLLRFPFTTLYRPGTTTPIASANDEVPLSAVDYVVLQYKGTQVDPCMAYFMNESANRGHKLVWKNDQFAVLEVAK
ncbi:MAG: hypothetical protein QXT19_01770 [Candidatus Woesearchaeota archaeon]